LSHETLIWEQAAGVGRLTLNRPDTLNAWTAQLGAELKQVVEGEAADESVRAVLVTGAARGFSSGADLKAGFEPADDGMPDIKRNLLEVYHPAIAGIRRLPKPVVAAVNGPAVGKARAFEMALLGERVPAERALEWGLVNWVHPDDRLMDEANALVERLAAGPTRSCAASKRALNGFVYGDLDAQLDLEAELQHALGRSKDFVEGAAAFVEGREPAFEGS
jgi:2-(1,2-epoxy-1,2-dihydrophenyl)acetyl-CoA isomerase